MAVKYLAFMVFQMIASSLAVHAAYGAYVGVRGGDWSAVFYDLLAVVLIVGTMLVVLVASYGRQIEKIYRCFGWIKE